MLILDAVIAIARSDVPDEWDRYCEIAPRVIGNVPDAPREMLRRARLRAYDVTLRWVSGGIDQNQDRIVQQPQQGRDKTVGQPDVPEAEEAYALEGIFLERFVAAVHARRCSVRGFRHGELAATDVDPMLIAVESFKHIRGDQQWELAGTIWYRVDVDMGPSPSRKLGNAGNSQIHAEIRAEYNDCEATGRKPPNLKEIGKLVQNRLRAKQLDASANRIQELAGDPVYDGLRRKRGKTVASEQRG